MKIVTWNCCGGFRNKFHLLEQFSADILIIQECEKPRQLAAAYQSWANNFLWIGGDRKGLGVFAKQHVQLEKLNWHDDGLQFFLPCRVNNQFNLLATWTKQGSDPRLAYIGQLWAYMKSHKAALSALPSIVCGDLNSNAIWDKQHRGSSHSDVVRELADINLSSLYHLQTNEKHGSESQPTFYLHRNTEKPYHIDYAFVSSSLLEATSKIEIGRRDFWLQHSDHMPLVFSVVA
jgi:exonuclease III